MGIRSLLRRRFADFYLTGGFLEGLLLVHFAALPVVVDIRLGSLPLDTHLTGLLGAGVLSWGGQPGTGTGAAGGAMVE